MLGIIWWTTENAFHKDHYQKSWKVKMGMGVGVCYYTGEKTEAL